MTEKEKSLSEILELQKALCKLDVVELPAQRRDLLKNRVLNQVTLKAPEFSIDPVMKMRIKERVFAYIENQSQKRFFWSNFFVWQRRFVAAFMLFLFAFTLVSYLNVSTKVVLAATFTTLDEFDGDVEILRDGKSIKPYAGMQIFEKDRVVTKEDGFAIIKFFDDTVSRLKDSTELSVEKLFKPQDSAVKTYVEIEVFAGEVWSRVVNLPLQQSSFVVDAQDLRLSTQKGAFNVKVSSDEVSVDVYNHTLDYSTPKTENKILSGEKVVLNADKSLQVEEVGEDDKRASWVVDNLNSDQRYLLEVEQRLLAAKMESLGMEGGDELSFSQTLGEKTLLFLTIDDVKQRKIELDLAEKNFVAAQVELSNPDLTEEKEAQAMSAVSAFSDKVHAFYDLVAEVKTTDVDYGSELERYVEDKVLSQKKVLSLVTKEQPSFKAKEVVDELELLSARDEKELVEIKAKQALDRYFEGDSDALKEITEVVNEYQYDDKFVDVIANITRSEANFAPVAVEEKAVETTTSSSAVLNSAETLSVVSDTDVAVGPVVDPVEDQASPPADSLVGENVFSLSEEYGVQVEGDKLLDPLLH